MCWFISIVSDFFSLWDVVPHPLLISRSPFSWPLLLPYSTTPSGLPLRQNGRKKEIKNKEIAPILFRRPGLCSVLLAWKMMFFLEFCLLESYHNTAVQQGYPQSMAGREKKILSFSPCAPACRGPFSWVSGQKDSFSPGFCSSPVLQLGLPWVKGRRYRSGENLGNSPPTWVTSLTPLPIYLLLFTFQNSQVVAFSILFSFLLWSVGELGSSDLTQSWLALDVSSF